MIAWDDVYKSQHLGMYNMYYRSSPLLIKFVLFSDPMHSWAIMISMFLKICYPFINVISKRTAHPSEPRS